MTKTYMYAIILSFFLGLCLSYFLFYNPCKETGLSTSCGESTLNEFRLEINIPDFKIENI